MAQEKDIKKKKRKRIVLIGLGVAAAGVLGYFGWDQYKKWKERKGETQEPEELPLLPKTTSSFIPPTLPKPIANDEFPLKKGSKGQRVKELQEALISKYGKTILPRYGADGSFGTEMITALKSKGLPEQVDENTFNVLVKTRSFDARTLAQAIYSAAYNKRFNNVITALKQMKNTDDYSSVSENFKLMRFKGVRQTLVNALLSTFTGSQKQQIQMEFLRMGLKYDGSKWSLAGIEPLRRIITVEPAIVWKDKHTGIKVPPNTVLGYELANRNGYSLFESIHKQNFLVKNESIKYL